MRLPGGRNHWQQLNQPHAAMQFASERVWPAAPLRCGTGDAGCMAGPALVRGHLKVWSGVGWRLGKDGKRSAEARLAAAQRGEARKLTIVLLDLLKQIEPVS